MDDDVTGQFLAKREQELDMEFMNELDEGSKLDPAFVQRQEAMKAKQEADAAAQPQNLPAGKTRNDVGQMVDKTNYSEQAAAGSADAVKNTMKLGGEILPANPDGATNKPLFVVDFGQDQNDATANRYISGDLKGLSLIHI